MKYRKRRPLRIRLEQLWKWLIAVLLLGGAIRGCESMNDLVAVYGENQCRNLVVTSTMEAVSQAETGEKLLYFTEIDKRNTFQLNSAAIRDFQTNVSVLLTQKLESLGEQSHRVRLGTVFSNFLLMDRGPEIAFRFVPVGSVQVSVTSDLQSAGINQVLYRVMLQVQTEMTILLPGRTKRIQCDQRIPIEEVILSGEVPLVYGG